MSNTIWEMTNEERDQVRSFLVLVEVGINNFQDLFKAHRETSISKIIQIAQLFPRCVEEEDNAGLMAEILESEILGVLHSFQKDKSMGPDGWPIEFYLGFYDLLGGGLLKVVKESRLAGHIHTPLNSTFLVVIPNTKQPLSFDDFRPISLFNCLYKIISKTIAKIILKKCYLEKFLISSLVFLKASNS